MRVGVWFADTSSNYKEFMIQLLTWTGTWLVKIRSISKYYILRSENNKNRGG